MYAGKAQGQTSPWFGLIRDSRGRMWLVAHRVVKCPKSFDDNIESESNALEKYNTRDGMEHEWNNEDVLLQRAWHLPRLNSSCLGLVTDQSVSVTPPQATNGERWRNRQLAASHSRTRLVSTGGEAQLSSHRYNPRIQSRVSKINIEIVL